MFPIFKYVLEQDITEFIPYAFQLLSLMLELHDQSIPNVYLELFLFLLMPVLWERPGYIPALVKLLQSYIKKASGTIALHYVEEAALHYAVSCNYGDLVKSDEYKRVQTQSKRVEQQKS